MALHVSFGQVRRVAAGTEAARRPSYYTSSPLSLYVKKFCI